MVDQAPKDMMTPHARLPPISCDWNISYKSDHTTHDNNDLPPLQEVCDAINATHDPCASNQQDLPKSKVMCDKCGKPYGRYYLKLHVAMHGSTKKQLKKKCDKCNRAFTRQSELTRHMRHTHGGEKNYKCVRCPRSFARKPDCKRQDRRYFDVSADIADLHDRHEKTCLKTMTIHLR